VADRPAKLWTPDEDSRLRRMVESDTNLADIAVSLGRSQKAVKSRAYSLRLSFKRLGVARRHLSKWG
jgi:hypothetical protein